MAYSTETIQKLVDEPLGAIASVLRSEVDPKTTKIGYNTRAFATSLDRSPEKMVPSVTASLELFKDIMLSSWVKFDCYGVDFGLGLGMPESVRRPSFTPVESLMYLLPKKPDGEITAAICLRDEDMERLKMDKEFAKYATFVG
jgi:trichothecene 3-O-acetyltransferase